jgi:hypothetical protein
VCPDGYKFSRGHRKGTGKESSDACETDRTDVGARTRHAENKRDVGDQAIAGAENGCTGGAALDIAMTTATNRLRPQEATQSLQRPRGDR